MATLQIEAGTTARTRIAWRLLPFLFLLYITNYLDRTNIANAQLGMKDELALSDSVFGSASGIFFIGYLALQIPGALLVERWSARRLLALTLITWGALTALTAFVHTPLQLKGARFLLGAAEAGFFPGVIVYLSHWFIKEDRAKAVALFMAAIPMGFIFGGPIAGVILGVDWLGFSGWRWLFLLEGVPAILFGIATLFFLPDRPRNAHWLTREEGDWIAANLAQERQAKADVEKLTVWRALRHPPVLILTTGLFFTYSGGYAFWFFEPTMLQRLTGWSVQRVTWMAPIIFGAGLVGMVFFGWSSDRTGERRWHFAIPQLTAALGAAAWFFLPHSNVILLIIFSVISFGTIAYLPSFWAMPSAFLSASAAAAAVGFINCMASIGGYFGPKIFGVLSQRTGSFNTGFILMIASFVVASVLVLVCPREGRH
jgi:MFS transporter, ACS family, tartrate transporter